MRTVHSAIRLPVVRRARCATGLHARSQMGQPYTFRIPPWAKCSDRRMERRIATRERPRAVQRQSPSEPHIPGRTSM